LDCPGGASSATAEINAAGGQATAADPVYGRSLTATELSMLAQSETDRGNAYVREHPEQYRWAFFEFQAGGNQTLVCQRTHDATSRI